MTKELAISILIGDVLGTTEQTQEAVGMAVKALSEVFAQPQRIKGRWLHGEAYPHHLYCSVCFRTALPNDEYVERWNLHMNFCPNCGADMRSTK